MKKPVALVTGCASGIGKQLGKRLIREGWHLVLADINEEGLNDIFGDSGHEMVLASLDVRSEADWRSVIQKALDEFGRIDYLMNIAGYLKPGYIHRADPQEIQNHLEINAGGAILGTRLVSEIMVSQGFGHIINLASMAGVAPVPGLSLYAASKFALRGFSLAVAQELKAYGVSVTVICPDAVKTPMLDLQVAYEEAALTFSGSDPLTISEIERVIMKRAIKRKPVEIILPTSRGILAKLASVWPNLGFLFVPSLKRRGIARQRTLRET